MEQTTQASDQFISTGVLYIFYKHIRFQQWTYQNNKNTLCIAMKGIAKLFLTAERKYLSAIHCPARCTYVLTPYALIRTAVHMPIYNTHPTP